jgi:chemotaxis protein CheX
MARRTFNVDYVNPVIEATCSVLRSMLGMEVVRGAIYCKLNDKPAHDVSGVINLTGAAQGTIVLSMSANVAIEATRILTGDKPERVDATVVDAVGELANIIAGNAKAKLSQLSLSIGLPRVVKGRDYAIAFPEGGTPIAIPFECTTGPITLEVALVEVPAALAAGAAS